MAGRSLSRLAGTVIDLRGLGVHDLVGFLQPAIGQPPSPLGGDGPMVDRFGNKITCASNSRKHFDILGKSSHRTLLSARRDAIVNRAICKAQGDGNSAREALHAANPQEGNGIVIGHACARLTVVGGTT